MSDAPGEPERPLPQDPEDRPEDLELIPRTPGEPAWMRALAPIRSEGAAFRTVLWAGVLYIVTAPLWLLFFLPGWLAWCVISLWFLYRIVRGMVAMNQSRPLNV